MSGVVVKLLGLAGDYPDDEHCGRWLVDYDPHYMDGRGLVVTSDDPAEARVFADHLEFHTLYKEAHGLRWDGKPNRPLTAYHIQVTRKEG